MQINRCESDLKPGDKVVMIGGDGTQYTVAGEPYYMQWLDAWYVWIKELEDKVAVNRLRKVSEVDEGA